MKKYILAVSLFLLSLCNHSHAHFDQDIDVITVEKEWFSILTTFSIETSGSDLGYVHRKFLSHVPEYHFHDQYDHLQAVARMRFFTMMPTFEVSDFDGFPMGMIEEHPHRFYPEFAITYPNGELFANAEGNFWGTKFTMYSAYFEFAIATFTKPFISLRDRSALHILNRSAFRPGGMDMRMMIIAATLKADSSHWKKIAKAYAQEHDHAGYGIIAIENDDPINAEIEKLSSALNVYASKYAHVEITEEAINKVEALTQPFLDTVSIEDRKSLINHRELVLDICQKITVLFDDENVTDAEKSALCLLLRKKITDLYIY